MNKINLFLVLFMTNINMAMAGNVIDIPLDVKQDILAKGFMDEFGKLQSLAWQVIIVLLGIAILVASATFIWAAFSFATSGGNPRNKSAAIKNMLISGVILTALGAFPFLVWLFISLTSV